MREREALGNVPQNENIQVTSIWIYFGQLIYSQYYYEYFSYS